LLHKLQVTDLAATINPLYEEVNTPHVYGVMVKVSFRMKCKSSGMAHLKWINT